jgi:integrase
MPLKIIPPRNNKTKNLYIRGSYLGVSVDQSSGTSKRSIARTILKQLEEKIEHGEYPSRDTAVSSCKPTFLSAAVAYLEAGKSRRYIAKLIKQFGETPLTEINQASIDSAAIKLYPRVTTATRNRCVHTPVAAILHHAKVKIQIERPKGAKGRVVTEWLRPEDAGGIIDAAYEIDPEFGLLLHYLLYTGPRLGEALGLMREDIRLAESRVWRRRNKGQDASDIRLREDLRDKLAIHLASNERRRVFRFHQEIGRAHV